MYGLYFILLFIILSIIRSLFDDNNSNEIIINKSYLPPKTYIISIWVYIYFILIYYFLNTNEKKDKNFLLRFCLLFFISLCFLYEIIVQGKSSRFLKNYNYFIFVFLILMSYMIMKRTNGKKYYIIPLIAWITYIIILTIIDDLNIKDLYIELNKD